MRKTDDKIKVRPPCSMLPFPFVWARLKSWATWVADGEIWFLVVGVTLTTFTTRWTAWGLGLLAALWPLRWLGRGRLTVPTPLEWPACTLLMTLPLTFYATTDPQATFIAVSRLLAGLALAYGMANWARRKAHLSLLVLGLAGVGLGLALLAPVSVGWFSKLPFVPPQLYERLPTLARDTVNANMMAGALVMALPLPLAALLLSSPKALPSVAGVIPAVLARVLDGCWFRRLWFGAAAALALAVLALTQSRGGWMAGGAVLFAILVRRWRGLLGLIPVALLGLGLLAWRGQLPALLDLVGSGGAISSLASRVEVWSRALYMIQDSPFTGVGAGTFQPVANALYPFFLAGPDTEIPHAHNLLLQVAVDLGLPGLVAFLAIILVAFGSALDSARFYRQTGEEALAAAAWGGLASLVGMLVHGVVDATTWTVGRGAFLPWAVIGMLVALQRRPSLDATGKEQ